MEFKGELQHDKRMKIVMRGEHVTAEVIVVPPTREDDNDFISYVEVSCRGVSDLLIHTMGVVTAWDDDNEGAAVEYFNERGCKAVRKILKNHIKGCREMAKLASPNNACAGLTFGVQKVSTKRYAVTCELEGSLIPTPFTLEVSAQSKPIAVLNVKQQLEMELLDLIIKLKYARKELKEYLRERA